MVSFTAFFGIALSLGLITIGLSYWYWTRRNLKNVILFSLAAMGLGILGGFVARMIGETISAPFLSGALNLAVNVWIYYYLSNKTRVFRNDKWLNILITVVVANAILGSLFMGWALSLDVELIAQAMMPLGG